MLFNIVIIESYFIICEYYTGIIMSEVIMVNKELIAVFLYIIINNNSF